MITKFIHWLTSHRLAAILVAIVYFALVIFPHEWVGVNVNALFKSMPRSSYDLIILVASLFLLILVLFFFGRKLVNHPERNKLVGYFGLTLLLIFFVNTFLFVVNIESVHYLQYGIGVILLFGIIGNYYVSLFVAFLVSIFDEGYQYFYLSPHRTDYFDINDIITDFLGAAFGLLLLKTLSIQEWGDTKRKMQLGLILPFLIFAISLLIALKSSLLSIFPSEQKYMLVRKMQEGFWTTVPPEVTFHVVGPGEGLIILSFLFILYYFCFKAGRPSSVGKL